MLHSPAQVDARRACFLSAAAFLATWLLLCSCAHTVTSYSRLSNSELKEFKHVTRLVVMPVPEEDRTSKVHKIKIMEDARIHRMTREVSEVTIQRYPFSAARKIDDCIIGVIGAPFTPLAILGGLVNGDAEMMVFPLSAWNPFVNFRPDKGGLFTGPIAMEYEKVTEEGDWTPVEPIFNLQPLVLSEIQVGSPKGKITVQTDGNGIAAIDLSQLFELGNHYQDLSLRISTPNALQCTYTVGEDRFLAIDARGRAVQPERPPVTLPPAPLPEKPKLLLARESERLLVYKVGDYGYWVNEDGVAVLALPAHRPLEAFADEYLRYRLHKPLEGTDGYYIFDFAFDPVRQITLAVKVGESPREKDALGWVSAQGVFLWNTFYRVRTDRPLLVYPTYESCNWQNQGMASEYAPGDNGALPVLEQKDSNWCIAYPGEGDSLHYGWVRWEKPAGKLEVRLMKHKIDAALSYMEQELIWGKSRESLEDDLRVHLHGPLSLLKVTWERFCSSFNKESYEEKSIAGRFIDVPLPLEDYRRFQLMVLSLADLLLKKNLWHGRDILYVPIDWEK